MKTQIVKLLRESGDVISGNALGTRLGSSRVAVWKHIQKLQEAGYDIESGPKGYRLRSAPDALYPCEFPGREERVVYLDEATSTMDVAKELARRGSPAFTVVIAGRQTRGRGRLRRAWHSEVGGLYFTVILRPSIPLQWCSRVNFLASLTLASILREDLGIEAGLKWPNDILVHGCKLCGLLSEMEAEDDQVYFINVGIGLNANNDTPLVEPPAISLKTILGRKVCRRDLLLRFLDRLEENVNADDWDAVIPQWKRYSVTLQKPVRIVTDKKDTAGIAVDVDSSGALLVRQADGSVKAVMYGDCFLNP
jgi:BirA family biotin operon repressor/biotin-[acetyl-CoA-carboxylase] ligase